MQGILASRQPWRLRALCLIALHRRVILPIIRRHLRSVSIVYSDLWAAYNQVQQLNSTTPVSESLAALVDPARRVHTQYAESYWNRVKGKFKRMKGGHESMMS